MDDVIGNGRRRTDGRWPSLAAPRPRIYALSVYLPVRSSRGGCASRAARGAAYVRDAHATALPQAAWREVLRAAPDPACRTDKADGNVNLAELAVLAQAAAAISPGRIVVEIGTFDGRTTLNLAVDAAPAAVFTLDLPPDERAAFALAPGKRRSSTSRSRARASAAAIRPGGRRRGGSPSCSAIRRRSTGRRTGAGPASCSWTARMPTRTCARIRRRQCGWSCRAASCCGTTMGGGRG